MQNCIGHTGHLRGVLMAGRGRISEFNYQQDVYIVLMQIQWNIGLRTPRFRYVSVYKRQFVEYVASVYIQKFGLRKLI